MQAKCIGFLLDFLRNIRGLDHLIGPIKDSQREEKGPACNYHLTDYCTTLRFAPAPSSQMAPKMRPDTSSTEVSNVERRLDHQNMKIPTEDKADDVDVKYMTLTKVSR